MTLIFFTAPRIGIPKTNFHAVFEVSAGFFIGPGIFRASACAAAAKKLAEQIAETCAAGAAKIESAEINLAALRLTLRAARRRAGALIRIKSVLVVHLALFRIGKNVVRFLNLLEFFFGRFVAGIQIGMILAREFTIGLPNFLKRRFLGDAKRLVIILFGSGRHDFPFARGKKYLPARSRGDLQIRPAGVQFV